MLISHTHNLFSTCGSGCRCEREFHRWDSLEADFRATGVETKDDWADELMVKRAEHGSGYVRINRAGRCLVDWTDALKAERNWLQLYERAVEQGKQIAKEQEDLERKEKEAEKEAEKERKKARFMGSFGKIAWE